MDNVKKLYRSRNDKMIGGVCGGIADYLKMDSAIIRFLFILFAIFGGTSIILYIFALIIVPTNPNSNEPVKTKYQQNFSFYIGSFFVILGLLFLLNNIGLIPHHFFHHRWEIIFSLGLIILGIFFIFRKKNINNTDDNNIFGNDDSDFHSSKTFYKSIKDKKLFGVCGGLAEYLQVDSTIVRIMWVIFGLLSAGAAVVLYFILAIILPVQKIQTVN